MCKLDVDANNAACDLDVYRRAVEFADGNPKARISALQRELRNTFNQAVQMIDRMWHTGRL